MAAPDLTPFAMQEAAARSNFAKASIHNTFNQGRAATMGRRSQEAFQRGFDRSMPKFTAGFAQRGLSGGGISSGVFRNAMQQRIGDFTRQQGYNTADLFDQDQQFNFNRDGYAATLNSELANLNAGKAATIAGTAQHLTALKPYYGS